MLPIISQLYFITLFKLTNKRNIHTINVNIYVKFNGKDIIKFLIDNLKNVQWKLSDIIAVFCRKRTSVENSKCEQRYARVGRNTQNIRRYLPCLKALRLLHKSGFYLYKNNKLLSLFIQICSKNFKKIR